MNKPYGIAIIGCGGIANYGSLACYKKHNLNADIIGCYDINHDTTLATSSRWNISRVYDNSSDIANDPRVNIVEIAVPPWHQANYAYEMASAGKHLLCQKPLCDNIKTAKSLVKVADVFGVKLAVNQQFRWSPLIVKLQELLAGNYPGIIRDVTLRVRVNTPWQMWPWLVKQPRLKVMYHSIHYLDTMRKLFGEPYAITSKHQYTDARVAGESKTLTVLDYTQGSYDYGFQVTLDIHHDPYCIKPEATLEVRGIDGIARGTIGTMYNYPNGRDDTLWFTGKEGDSIYYHLNGQWIPDGFVGPISGLMNAIRDDTEPDTSGRDHIKTLELVEACYMSAATGRTVYMKTHDATWFKLNK